MTSTTIPSLALVLILGMRHGLDPDHLAAIDGLTLRTQATNPNWAPWCGGCFALGHGLVVICLAYAASLAPEFVTASEALFSLAEWVPIILLFVLGVLNARALMQQNKYRPLGLRAGFLPGWTGKLSGPVAAMLVGVLFALVFDTALQAAAWGYAAKLIGGTIAALMAGLIFSVGMIVTDLVDGWVTARVLRSGHADAVAVFRRRLGWPVVAMCFAMSAYGLIGKFDPTMQISEACLSGLGGAMLAIMALIYGYSVRSVVAK